MYIYIVYSFCTTLPIAWQSICDLRSCKAMTLDRFISLSCHFIYFFYVYSFLFFFSLTSFVSAGSERGGSDPAVTMERTGTLDLTFFISPVCQCPHKSSSASFSENTGNISGTVRGERRRSILSMDMQHPVDNRRTDGPAHRPAEPRADGQTMVTKRWDGPPLHVPEREMALILAWWHTTGQPLGC